ncbi:polyprenyl synthetase family protein [Nocardia panacis]|uniref:Polyprenyl synthetase family protein n=1 Tax=Nocardia panacis TaxID=2340916 RepID=A0A3A4K0U1_9NOCA|nr:polyprenyl synthetase family protein [Nocardia panacis]RJO70913.1 polyprenyl synthetase family protein [Nocardia panacis]
MTANTLGPTTKTSRAAATRTADHRAPDLLLAARRACEPILRESIGALPDPLRRMAGYHFGWWNVGGVPTAADSGKSLRAALTRAAAAACGGADSERAAAAVELLHNFTLVHDDVMDRDRTRRGRATIWAIWGANDAILLGDVLHTLSFRMVCTGLPVATTAGAVSRLAHASIEVCRGQQEDCEFETRTGVTMGEYIAMAAGKTGALMGCATALGALCAGADPETVSALDTFGRELGLAFQFVDDIMGLWGDPAVTGKPAGRDLVRRKRTLPIVAALETDTEAARTLAGRYRSSLPMTPAEIAAATELVTAAGGRETALRHANERIDTALAALPAELRADDLRALARLVTDRER